MSWWTILFKKHFALLREANFLGKNSCVYLLDNCWENWATFVKFGDFLCYDLVRLSAIKVGLSLSDIAAGKIVIGISLCNNFFFYYLDLN